MRYEPLKRGIKIVGKIELPPVKKRKPKRKTKAQIEQERFETIKRRLDAKFGL